MLYSNIGMLKGIFMINGKKTACLCIGKGFAGRLPAAVLGFVLLTCSWSCQSPEGPTARPSDSTQPASLQPAPANKKNILFFGNSLTAGYGLQPRELFTALIQSRLDSLGLPYHVVNAGISGETTADGRSRIDWVLQQPLAIFVLELGGNDGLRGLPVTETRSNLQAIIDKVKSRYPAARILLTGMLVPPNMGSEYGNQFLLIFPELAKKNQLTLLPFLLEGVGGVPSLNQSDGIHPTAEGDRIVAENVWRMLKSML